MLRLPPEVQLTELFDAGELVALGNQAAREAFAAAASALIPNRPMDIVEWAESTIRLPNTTSNQDGALRLTDMQKGILRAYQERGASVVVQMGVPRILKTTNLVIVGFYTAFHEGADSLFYERSRPTGQVLHDTNIMPIIEASPRLRALLRTGQRNGGTEDKWTDRILENGAALRIRSVADNGTFRQVKGKAILVSEAGDKAYGDNGEGEKINLALKRGQSYSDSRGYIESSPTEEGLCAITRWFKLSDQRHFWAPCPHCGTFQVLQPKVGAKDGAGLKYVIDPKTNRVTDCWYQCVHCSDPIREKDKRRMFAKGYWEAEKPAAARPGTIGFHQWAIHSLDPKSAWPKICEAHFAQLGDPSLRQNFKNTWLGLWWERHAIGAVDIDVLEQRCEPYEAPCPAGVRVITIGVDGQQGNLASEEEGGKPARLEATAVGYGYSEECWILGHYLIEEEPFSPEANARLIELFEKEWRKPDGTLMTAAGACVDVNYQMVNGLNFIYGPDVRKLRMKVWPIVGKNEGRGTRTKLASETQSARSKSGRRILQLGTQAGKDALERRKRIETGPEAIHMPQSLIRTKTERAGLFDWFKSFSAIAKRMTDDTKKTYWVDRDGNEAIDCWVYSLAALQLLKEKSGSVKRAIALDPDAPAHPYDGPDHSDQSLVKAELTMVDMPNAGLPAKRVWRPGGRTAPEPIRAPEPSVASSQDVVAERQVRKQSSRMGGSRWLRR
jgi:phage terminase large subunit GpA-like protein